MENEKNNKRLILSPDEKANIACPLTASLDSSLSSSTDYQLWAVTGQRPRPCLNAWHRLMVRHS